MIGPEIAVRITAVGADGVRRELSQVDAQLKQVGSTADSAVGGSDRLFGSLGRVGQLAVGGGALAGVAASALAIGRALIDASVAAERLSMGLSFATGNAPRDLEYLRGLTDRLGLQFGTTATAYMQFAAAARQTSLEGEGARRVFEAISKASAVMGLSASESQGALLALQQMISKGTVSAEELRGQLGERLPGSFQIAARSMGVTTQELGKMLEQGQILAEDFLPKFAAQLEKELGGAAEKAADRTEAAINRMSNAWSKLMQTMGQAGASDAGGWFFNAIANDLNAISDAMENARNQGGGWLRQWTEAASTVVGRMMGLQGVLPVFRTAQQQADAMAAQLVEAEAEMIKLQARLAQNPESFYLRNDIAQLQSFIDKAREARQAANLAGMPDQTDAEGMRLRRGAGEDQFGAETRRLGRGATGAAVGSAASEFLKTYASDAAKLSQELMRAREAFGGVIPPDVERAIRERFVKPARESGEEVRKLAELLQGATGLNADWAANVSILGRALAQGKISQDAYNKAIQDLVDKQPAIKAAADERKRFLDSEAKASLEAIKRYDAAEAAADAQVSSAKDLLASIQRETAALKMSTTERAISNAMRDLEAKGIKAGTAAYEEYAEAIRKAIIDQEAVRASIENTREIEAEWKRMTQDIERSLTDAIMRGFEGGRSFIDSFVSAIKSAFQTMVLRPIVQAVVQPFMGAMGNAMGIPGAPGGGSAIGDAVSFASMASRVGSFFGTGPGSAVGNLGLRINNFGNAVGSNGLSTFGADMFAGTPGTAGGYAGMAGSYLAGASLGVYGGRAISGGYAYGGGSGNAAVNIGTAIGAAIAGPIGAAVGGMLGGVANRAFGYGPKSIVERGVVGSFGPTGFSGQAYSSWEQKGGWFRGNKGATDFTALGEDIDAALNAGGAAIRESAKQYAAALGLPVGYMDSIVSQTKIVLTGDQEKDTKAITDALNLYGDALTAFLRDRIQPLAREGERILDTMQRLAGLQTFSRTLADLGGVFGRVANLAVDAKEQMIELAGGMDQFAQQALGFVQNFYNRDEIAGLKSRELQGVLSGLGITQDLTGADAMSQFRALVEGTDVSTEAGRRQLATLLSIQGDIVQVGQYLTETGQSLSQTAAMAPVSAQLQSVFQTGASQQVAATMQTGQMIVSAIERLGERLRDGGNGRGGFGGLIPRGALEVTTIDQVAVPEGLGP